MMKHTLFALLAATALSACDKIPATAYYDRGTPESLLDVSSEVVNVALGSERSVSELSEWINRDQPSRAELYCSEGDLRCSAAQEVLSLYNVPTMFVPSPTNTVTLVYERVLARDCENRYVDNPINPYNLSHPTFGCTMAVNTVQMVSNKHQFVSPNLLDYPDGEKAVQVYDNYLEPPVVDRSQDFESNVENISLDQ